MMVGKHLLDLQAPGFVNKKTLGKFSKLQTDRTQQGGLVASSPLTHHKNIVQILHYVYIYSKQIHAVILVQIQHYVYIYCKQIHAVTLLVSPGTHLVKNCEAQLKNTSPKLKMPGPSCNQAVNLKTDSKTLYYSILEYSTWILKHNKG